MIYVKECNCDIEECEKRAKARIAELGAGVFTVIDHKEAAIKAGLDLEPTKVIYFGNPKVGTLLMQANRSISYELPLKIGIWSENGKTFIGYKKPSEIASEYGIPQSEIITKIEKVMEEVVEAASAGTEQA